MDLSKYIGVTPNFPKEGISFKDVSPLLADSEAFRYTIDELAKLVEPLKPDLIIGPESRGFLFGAPLALKLGCGFAMARKKGKLPGEVLSKTYTLEYNQATIEISKSIFRKGLKVVVIDDLLATGGTLKAVIDLVREEGGEVKGAFSVIELEDLKGREFLGDTYFESLIKLND